MKRFATVIIAVLMLCMLTVSFVACDFGGRKDDGAKESYAQNDETLMAISRVKNANYTPDVEGLLGVESSASSSKSASSAEASMPAGALTSETLGRAEFAFDDKLGDTFKYAKKWGEDLKEEIFDFIDKAVAFDKWITDSSIEHSAIFKVHYDAISDKVTVYYALGGSLHSIAYYMDTKNREVIESYKYYIEPGHDAPFLISYEKYVEDSEWLTFGHDSYERVLSDDGVMSYDSYSYDSNDPDQMSVSCIRELGNIRYWLSYYGKASEYSPKKAELNYQIDGNTLVSFYMDGTIGNEGRSVVSTNVQFMDNWAFYMPSSDNYANTGELIYASKAEMDNKLDYYPYHFDAYGYDTNFYALTDACKAAAAAQYAEDPYDMYWFFMHSDVFVRNIDFIAFDSIDTNYYKQYDGVQYASALLSCANPEDILPKVGSHPDLGETVGFVNCQTFYLSFNNSLAINYYIEEEDLKHDVISLDDIAIKGLLTDSELTMSIAPQYRQAFKDALALQNNGIEDYSVLGISNLQNDAKRTELNTKLKNTYKDDVLVSIPIDYSTADITPEIDLDKVDITIAPNGISTQVRGTTEATIADGNAKVAVDLSATIATSILIEKGKNYNAALVLCDGNEVIETGLHGVAAAYNGADMSFAISGTWTLDAPLTFGKAYTLCVAATKTIDGTDRIVGTPVAVSTAQTNTEGYIAKNFALVAGEDYTYGYGFINNANTLQIVKNGTDVIAPTLTVSGLTFTDGYALPDGTSNQLSFAATDTITDLLAKASVSDNLDTMQVRLVNLAIYKLKDGADNNSTALSDYEIDVVATADLTYSATVRGGLYGLSVKDSAGNATMLLFNVRVA